MGPWPCNWTGGAMNSPIPRTVAGVDVSTGNLRIAMLHSSLGRLKLPGTFKLEQFENMDLLPILTLPVNPRPPGGPL